MKGHKDRKIILVEDDPNNHPLFAEAFSAAGFEVVIFPDADSTDFIGEVLSATPDIISMDLMIARENNDALRDGFEAVELLKSDERTKDIPIMILTTFFEERKVTRAKELGAVDFISLQGHDIKRIPDIFNRYLDNPKKYVPMHPLMRG
ncbi:MAG: response regulator [Candidatus Kaiserbacteria bacterium]|nr:response regulator [Candidatus Kaiserbacteria bacterium]MCB9816889.1 response regulator [Candidatus Nomurabacteria bacterium]